MKASISRTNTHTRRVGEADLKPRRAVRVADGREEGAGLLRPAPPALDFILRWAAT